MEGGTSTGDKFAGSFQDSTGASFGLELNRFSLPRRTLLVGWYIRKGKKGESSGTFVAEEEDGDDNGNGNGENGSQ